MIKHCVFVNFRSEISSEARKDIFAKLSELVEEIDGMIDFAAGPNRDFEKKSQDFSDGLVASFADAAALATYADHPKHVELARALVAMCEGGMDGILVFDIEAH